MEKIYYSGKILNLNNLLTIDVDIGDLYDLNFRGHSKSADLFLSYFDTIETNKKKKFLKEMRDKYENNKIKLSSLEFSEEMSKINGLIEDNYNYKSTKVIFEIITSESGDLYAKELLTGLLFPIVTFNKVEYRLSLRNFMAHYEFKLRPIINSFENLNLCESIIFNYKVANINEIGEYKNRFDGTFKKNNKKRFIKQITTQYNKNIFNSEIKEKEETKKNKIEKDKITLKLENIEYLLAKLKRKHNDMYVTFFNEYNELINSENKSLTLTPVTLENLTLLEGKIEFYLNYSKNNSNNISSLLNDLKNEYLKNFKNNKDEITKLTITKIDKIYELFLKTRTEYLLKDQTKILKDIAFLYIMETIEDNDIKVTDLENGYFNDNLKYIMMTIMSLIDDGVIKDNIEIDLDDELNIYNVYNIIKNIEFQKEKQK